MFMRNRRSPPVFHPAHRLWQMLQHRLRSVRAWWWILTLASSTVTLTMRMIGGEIPWETQRVTWAGRSGSFCRFRAGENHEKHGKSEKERLNSNIFPLILRALHHRYGWHACDRVAFFQRQARQSENWKHLTPCL